MVLAKVIGNVVATKKVDNLEGFKLLIIEDINLDLKCTGKTIVAVDTVGAGENEIVLYTSGSSARQTTMTDKKPVDHCIVAIVDEVVVNGKKNYAKN